MATEPSRRRQAVGHCDGAARSRHQDGRPAALRPDHRGGPSRHGAGIRSPAVAYNASEAHRRRDPTSSTTRNPVNGDVVGFFSRNLAEQLATPSSSPSCRIPSSTILRWWHHRRRFRRSRLFDRTAVAAVRQWTNRRRLSMSQLHRAPPAASSRRPRSSGGRLHPSCCGDLANAATTTASGSHRDHHQRRGAHRLNVPPHRRAVTAVAPGQAATTSTSANCRTT